MSSKKWSTGESRELSGKPLHGVLLVARNKDNKNIEGFKERRKAFLTTKTVEELEETFYSFLKEGLPGETARLYYSLNSRSQEKVQKALIHKLIDTPLNLGAIEAIVAGIGMTKECAVTKKWFFDYDDTEENLPIFLKDLDEAIKENPSGSDIEITTKKTPNGYAIIVSRGFQTDKLLAKWGETVSLKRDDLICSLWGTNEK